MKTSVVSVLWRYDALCESILWGNITVGLKFMAICLKFQMYFLKTTKVRDMMAQQKITKACIMHCLETMDVCTKLCSNSCLWDILLKTTNNHWLLHYKRKTASRLSSVWKLIQANNISVWITAWGDQNRLSWSSYCGSEILITVLHINLLPLKDLWKSQLFSVACEFSRSSLYPHSIVSILPIQLSQMIFATFCAARISAFVHNFSEHLILNSYRWMLGAFISFLLNIVTVHCWFLQQAWEHLLYHRL